MIGLVCLVHKQRLLVAKSSSLSVRFLTTSPNLLHRTNAPPAAPSLRDPLDLAFTDARTAYRSKSTLEILRALIVFQCCSSSYLVDNNERLMQLGRHLLGSSLFERLMKSTFYGHFVAGEDQLRIQPQLQRLREFGVSAILDYSVEEDISQDEAVHTDFQSLTPISGDRPPADDVALAKYTAHKEFLDRRKNAVARTYFYLNEAACEKNVDIFLQCIEAVSGATTTKGGERGGGGFAAIKLTALGRPQLLLQLSEGIARVHRYVGAVTGKRGHVMEQGLQPEDLARRLASAARQDPTVQAWLDNMTFDSSGLIHILPWKGLVEASKGLRESLKVADLSTGKMEDLVPPLSPQEEEMFKNMMRRLHTIFSVASKLNVRVMVDAEQSYFQPAISRITMEMMRKYNTDKAVVFNTYQCYLRKVESSLKADLEQAERQGFCFGAKLVRGAYMEQERARAAGMGYPDPINPSFESTSATYHRCMEEGLRRIQRMKAKGKNGSNPQNNRICLMAATHNEDTVRFVIQKMEECGIEREEGTIAFGQLYGMADHISFPLGQSGYSVYKYVPYGPVSKVLPYLSRRAQENRSVIGKTKKENLLLRKEALRRILSGQLFYRPTGHHQHHHQVT